MINLIIGTMFAGKSTELLKYLRRSCIAKKKVCLLRPDIDTRSYLTHDEESLYQGIEVFSLPVSCVQNFPDLEDFLKYDTIGIDEWQFFPIECWDSHLFPFLVQVQDQDKECHITGLSGTFYLTVFDIISRTIPLVNHIQLESAICLHCGCNAYYTYRHESQVRDINDDERSTDNIGSEDKYSALCWHCWHKIHNKTHRH